MSVTQFPFLRRSLEAINIVADGTLELVVLLVGSVVCCSSSSATALPFLPIEAVDIEAMLSTM